MLRIVTATLVVMLTTAAAHAQTAISVEGAYLWGSDWIDLGDPPDFPGKADYGDGWYGGVTATAGSDDFYAQLAFRYLATSNDAGATRTTVFGTTVEDYELDQSFLWVDIDLGTTIRHHDQQTRINLFGGIRYLNANHDFDAQAITTNGSVTSVFEQDRLAFNGAGPHAAAMITRPVSNRVALFAGIGGAILFGSTHFDQHVEIFFDGVPFGTIDESASGFTIAYALDAQIGLSVALGDPTAGAPATLSVGYRGDAWWNIAAGRSVFEFYPQTSNVAIHHGPFARLTVPFDQGHGARIREPSYMSQRRPKG